MNAPTNIKPMDAALDTLRELIVKAKFITPGGALSRRDIAGLIIRAARMHGVGEFALHRAYWDAQGGAA